MSTFSTSYSVHKPPTVTWTSPYVAAVSITSIIKYWSLYKVYCSYKSKQWIEAYYIAMHINTYQPVNVMIHYHLYMQLQLWQHIEIINPAYCLALLLLYKSYYLGHI